MSFSKYPTAVDIHGMSFLTSFGCPQPMDIKKETSMGYEIPWVRNIFGYFPTLVLNKDVYIRNRR
jgi:hypothetical protein